MRRFVVIALGSIAALMLSVFLAAFLLFKTGTGRGFVVSQLEPVLSNNLGGDVQIENLSGELPGKANLKNISLLDLEGEWATVGTVEIDWHPLGLFFGSIDVERISVSDVHLFRVPKFPPPSEEKETKPLDFNLLDNLPKITIGEIALANIRSDLSGETVRLDGLGSIVLHGRHINSHLGVTSEDNKDVVDIALEFSPETKRLYIDATLSALPGGVIASIAQLNAPFFLEAKSDSPSDNAVIHLNSKLADYGALETSIKGNLVKLNSVKLDALFTPGDAVRVIDELGQPVSLLATYARAKDNSTLSIDQLHATLGDITGLITWEENRHGVQSLNSNLNIALADGYRPEIQKFTGARIDSEAALTRQRNVYNIDAYLDSPGLRLTIDKAATDLRKVFSGKLRAIVTPLGTTSPLPSIVEINTKVDLQGEEVITLQGLSIASEDGSFFDGNAEYSFRHENISLLGALEASPLLVRSYLPSVTPSSNITADIELSGPLKRFSGSALVHTPDVQMNESVVPALNIQAEFTGLPSLPTGEIIADGNGGSGAFNMLIRSSVDGRINIPELSYKGEGFTLGGNSQLTTTTKTLDIDLNYTGDEGAMPWPGLSLMGDLAVTGAISLGPDQTAFSIHSTSLMSEQFTINELNLTASGSSDDILVNATSSQLVAANLPAIDDLTAAANIDLSTGQVIKLSKLSGLFAKSPFALERQAQISFGDATALENLLMSWGETGRIELDAQLKPDHWLASLVMTDIDIPNADGIASLKFNLDTNEQVLAHGDIALRSLLTNGPASTVKAGFVWNGETINIGNASDEKQLDMRIALPAKLIRGNSMHIDTSGIMAGHLIYNGQAETMTGYFPSSLQSLEGSVAANFTVDGTFNDPKIIGEASLQEGAYTELSTNLSLIGMHAKAVATYAPEGSFIEFSGGARGAKQTGADSLILGGRLSLADILALDLSLQFKDTDLSAYPVNTIRANGVINVKGSLDSIQVEGAVDIDELDAEIITPASTGLVPIDIVTYDGLSNQPETASRPSRSNITYDLQINADDRIFIRGRGLDSEWSATTRVSTEKQKPVVIGAITLERGTLDFSGRRFDVTNGDITFDRLSENVPRIDLSAEYETENDVLAIISIKGRADNLAIELTSTPTLPAEDVMALILFSKPGSELSALEAVQTAQALASLGGIGPFGGGGVTRMAREAIGLDLLNLDIDPEKGGASLTVGKYVADGVFVSATQDAKGESGSVHIEYEVTDSISVETELKQDGDQTISANWKRDF